MNIGVNREWQPCWAIYFLYWSQDMSFMEWNVLHMYVIAVLLL